MSTINGGEMISMPIHLIGATEKDLGEVTLLAGDPKRIRSLGDILDDSKIIVNNREYILINGFWKGRKVSLCSTGIGIGSTEIAMIELMQLGARNLIRVGGCGAWDPNIKEGDIILNHAMVRNNGMLQEYCDDTFPAVANPFLVNYLKEAFEELQFNVHVGIGMTTESYYLGQGRETGLGNGPDVESLMDYWRKRNIINCDMETAAIFILGSIYGVKVANCLVAHGSRITNKWVPDTDYQEIHIKATRIVLDAVFKSINDEVE